MDASAWKVRANRRNAQKSTGPKSEEGKEISRRNAYKHGLRALVVDPEENTLELEQERREWLKSFRPKNEAALLLADWSFRCKRRLDRVSDAYDSGVAANMADAVKNFYIDRSARIDKAVETLPDNTFAAHLELSSTVMGCKRLLDLIDQVEEALENREWNADWAQTLNLAVGLSTHTRDPELSQWTAALLAEANLEKPDASLAEAAEEAREGIRDRIEGSRELIEDRISKLGDEEKVACRRAYDMARIDHSPEGCRNHRYLNEAHRQFFKYFELTMKALKGEFELTNLERGVDLTLSVISQTPSLGQPAPAPTTELSVEPQLRPKLQPMMEVKTEPKVQAKPEPKVDVEAEPKVDVKSEPKPTAESVVKAPAQVAEPARSANAVPGKAASPNEAKARSAVSSGRADRVDSPGYSYVPFAVGKAPATVS
jgi:hypothetical protein